MGLIKQQLHNNISPEKKDDSDPSIPPCFGLTREDGNPHIANSSREVDKSRENGDESSNQDEEMKTRGEPIAMNLTRMMRITKLPLKLQELGQWASQLGFG